MNEYGLDELKSFLKFRSAFHRKRDESKLDIQKEFLASEYIGDKNVISSYLMNDPLKGTTSWAIYNEIVARQTAVYGDDDRIETIALSDLTKRNHAHSVAAVFQSSKLISTSHNCITIESISLAEKKFNEFRIPLCNFEPFREQPAVADGTAFLVTPTIVATAGHVINKNNFHKRQLIFNYEASASGKITLTFSTDQVYSVRRFICGEEERMGADWSLLELDRPVLDRKPLAIRKRGIVVENEPLYVIGHPLGLPKKIAGKAMVRDSSSLEYFIANLDTYGGNSGSPVFNEMTHEVEGILARGERDFVQVENCMASLVCPDNGCRGEACTRISPVTSFLQTIT